MHPDMHFYCWLMHGSSPLQAWPSALGIWALATEMACKYSKHKDKAMAVKMPGMLTLYGCIAIDIKAVVFELLSYSLSCLPNREASARGQVTHTALYMLNPGRRDGP